MARAFCWGVGVIGWSMFGTGGGTDRIVNSFKTSEEMRRFSPVAVVLDSSSRAAWIPALSALNDLMQWPFFIALGTGNPQRRFYLIGEKH